MRGTAMDPLTALLVTLSISCLAGAVYAAQIEARHHRQIGADNHKDELSAR